MHTFGLNAFCRIVGDGRNTVKTLVSQGDINHVIKRCDRLEFDADAALEYLAKKYPQLLKAKHEYAGQQTRIVNYEIVKEETVKGIVKWGREADSYMFDNYGTKLP